MLVGLLNIIFQVAIFLVNVASWVVIVYVILTLVIPQNKYTLLAGRYIEPVLAPIRTWLAKAFSGLRQSRLDFSPAVLWLMLRIAVWLLQLLRNILL